MSRWRETPVVFECRGEQLLGIVHHAAEDDASLGVLIVVGGPQYRVGSHRQFALMARAIAESGHPVFRFDYRGMGDSEGSLRSFEAVDDDIRAALAAFQAQAPALRGIVLWGLCDAASAIMMSTSLPAIVVGQVLVNPWVRTPESEARAYVRHYYARRVLQRNFWRKLLGGKLDAGYSVKQFLATLRASKPLTSTQSTPSAGSYIDRMRRGLQAFDGPVLFVLSGRDLTAREFEALRERSPEWQRALAAPRVHLLRLAGADHTFSDGASLREGMAAMLRWVEQAIGVAA